MDTDEAGTSTVGYTTRDLVIQANAKLDSISPEIKELRSEQSRLRIDVDALQTDLAVRKAEHGYGRTARNIVYASLVLLAYWFGPVIDKAISH